MRTSTFRIFEPVIVCDLIPFTLGPHMLECHRPLPSLCKTEYLRKNTFSMHIWIFLEIVPLLTAMIDLPLGPNFVPPLPFAHVTPESIYSALIVEC